MATERLCALVVEDHFLLAEAIADSLRTLGYVAASRVGTLEDGLKALDTLHIDLAIVDINLRGADAYPLLDVMSSRGIEFVIATVEEPRYIPRRFANRPLVYKPYNLCQLSRAVRRS